MSYDELFRAFGAPPPDYGPRIDEESSQANADIWGHVAAMFSAGARPAALEAQSACSFCVGLNGDHAKNCLRRRPPDDE